MSSTLQPPPDGDSGKNNKINELCQGLNPRHQCPGIVACARALADSALSEATLQAVVVELRHALVIADLKVAARHSSPLLTRLRTTGGIWQDAMDSGE